MNSATFTDSLLEIRRTVIDTNGIFAFFSNGHIYAGAAHRLTDNFIRTTYALRITTGHEPKQAAIGYYYSTYFYTGSLLEMYGNDVYVGTTYAYGLYVRPNVGRIIHDDTNRYSGGHIYVYHMASTANNFFVLNQSTGMQSITYSGAAAGQYKDDIIGIYNTDALSASVDLGTVSGMSLTLGGVLLNTFTASASKYTTVNVGIVNVSIASTFSIDPTTVFGSCLMLNDVTTSSTASSIRGTYTNSTNV